MAFKRLASCLQLACERLAEDEACDNNKNSVLCKEKNTSIKKSLKISN